jgi:transcriptional regulator with XRE-family HTH domain
MIYKPHEPQKPIKAMEQILSKRHRLRIKQKTLAQAAGISVTYLCLLENGVKRNPSHDVITNLENALDQLVRERQRKGGGGGTRVPLKTAQAA